MKKFSGRATSIAKNLPKSISFSFSLEEGGATALGPALLFSITMASQRTASKVIICTDGLANVGLGSLDGMVYCYP